MKRKTKNTRKQDFIELITKQIHLNTHQSQMESQDENVQGANFAPLFVCPVKELD